MAAAAAAPKMSERSGVRALTGCVRDRDVFIGGTLTEERRGVHAGTPYRTLGGGEGRGLPQGPDDAGMAAVRSPCSVATRRSTSRFWEFGPYQQATA